MELLAIDKNWIDTIVRTLPAQEIVRRAAGDYLLCGWQAAGCDANDIEIRLFMSGDPALLTIEATCRNWTVRDDPQYVMEWCNAQNTTASDGGNVYFDRASNRIVWRTTLKPELSVSTDEVVGKFIMPSVECAARFFQYALTVLERC